MPKNHPTTRRHMLAMTATALCAPYFLRGQKRGEVGPRIERIDPMGPLVRESTMPGHRLSDGVVPAHPNGWQLSKNRWMIFYSTRGFRGIDDDWSMVYQLRKDAPDGPVICEGFLKRTRNDWDPVGDGSIFCAMQHSHPVIYGVPKGALIHGKPAANANVFVATWRRKAVYWNKATNRIEHPTLPTDPQSEYVRNNPILTKHSIRFLGVESAQFRLNANEDDIEIIQPVTLLRQKGFETGERFCNAPVRNMNAGYVTPVPFNDACTEWITVNHFAGGVDHANGGQIACCKYAFNPKIGRYEWTETGPMLGGRKGLSIFEGCVTRYRDEWIIGARLMFSKAGMVWSRTADPFGKPSALIVNAIPGTTTPRTEYVCADGVLRLFAGDISVSYYANARDPLYTWDIDPANGFGATNRRVVFDLFKYGLDMRRDIQPWADNCKLLPPQGRQQMLVYRVHASANDLARSTTAAFWKNDPKIIPAINAKEKAQCGVYHSVITYSDDVPPMWRFG